MNKNKKFLLPLLTLSLALLSAGIISSINSGEVIANDSIDKILVPKEEAEEYINEQYRINGKVPPSSLNFDNNFIESKESPYEQYYQKATQIQKDKLDKIINDDRIDLPGEWKRDVLITMDELSQDTPRLSVSDVETILEQNSRSNSFFTDTDYVAAFNKIAGAPDWEGGSGIYRYIYFLNDEHTEAMFVMLGSVTYVIFDEYGNQEVKPIGNQVLPQDPGPYKGSEINDDSFTDDINRSSRFILEATPAPLPPEE